MKIQILSVFLFACSALFFSCENQPTNKAFEKNQPSSILAETFILYKNFPAKNIDPRNIEIWLPENYQKLDSLPVLYMMDGQNIFHGTRGWNGGHNPGWRVNEVLDSLSKAGAIDDIMVVGIFNLGAKRGIEYMPAKPVALIEERRETLKEDWYSIWIKGKPESDAFLKFVVEELKPFVDANYKTKSSTANTFIAGSSMGGLISAYAICEYPRIFGAAACLSTHWIPLDGVFTEYIKDHLPDPSNHKIYFDYGTEGLDAQYEPFQKKVDQYMQAKGFEENKNWKTLKVEGADHNESSWHQRLAIPLEFLSN